MKVLVVLIALLAASPHGEVEDSLRELDRCIAAEPGRLDLRLRRGELLRVHGAPLEGLADFDQVLVRDPSHPHARFFKALAFRDLKRWASARRELDRHLAKRPDHPEGLRLSAKLATDMGAAGRAVADWRALFALPAPVSPDDALAFAAAARLAAEPGLAPAERAALEALEVALARLGPAVAIELEAARCEARLGELEAFERRFAALEARAARRDWFRKMRRSILAEARRAEAPVEEGGTR